MTTKTASLVEGDTTREHALPYPQDPMPAEEHNEEEHTPEGADDVFDFDDVDVSPADGMLIKHDDAEVRLLFFYIKPAMKGKPSYKAVTELRIPRHAFMHIADDIHTTATTIRDHHDPGPHTMYI